MSFQLEGGLLPEGTGFHWWAWRQHRQLEQLQADGPDRCLLEGGGAQPLQHATAEHRRTTLQHHPIDPGTAEGPYQGGEARQGWRVGRRLNHLIHSLGARRQ